MNTNDTPVILLVDDDGMIRKLTSALLQAQGYAVVQAESGSRGMECFAKYRQALAMVLSDVVMPEMSGPEMVRQILEIDPRTRVMFMTGQVEQVLPERFQTGYAVLRKPFTREALVDSVRACLSAQG
jgi:CheY-like chemotaxis protein